LLEVILDEEEVEMIRVFIYNAREVKMNEL
jgi:hypothetical protein